MSAFRLRSPLFALVRAASLALVCSAAAAQDDATESAPADAPLPSASATVDVDPSASDERIEERLGNILNATLWFEHLSVEAEQGIVFLQGRTREERYRDWASDLVRRTEGVVAVVNRIELAPRALTDMGPAREGLASLWEEFLRNAPLLLVAALCVLAAYGAGRGSTWALLRSFHRSGHTDLVRDLAARGAGLMVFTFGVYIALRVAGLTRLAATVLGGTGVFGLVLGIAFRDIAENMLASILLTRQQPFRRGDLVEIAGIEGVVQRLTARATVLMSLDGNHVQIPNSTVYKSAIRNFTSNPKRRIDFTIEIGQTDPVASAQEIALTVVSNHPAVLATPEPWVLAEALDGSVVRLRVYLWLDGSRHAWLKVRSSVLRLVKIAFQAHGISMPEHTREVIVAEGLPLHRAGAPEPEHVDTGPGRGHAPMPTPSPDETSVATHAEADLAPEERQIAALAAGARRPAGQDLLANSAPESGRA